MRGGVLSGPGGGGFDESAAKRDRRHLVPNDGQTTGNCGENLRSAKIRERLPETAKSASDRRRKLALRRLPPFPSPKFKGLELRLQAARQLSGWQRFTLAARRNGCPPRPSPHCVWNNAHHRELMCQTSVKSISAINLDFVKLQQISAKITEKNNRIH